jgi:hypothetical protein
MAPINNFISIKDQIWFGDEAKLPWKSNHHHEHPLVRGQFASVREDSEHFWLIRDRLGINKLFYHTNKDSGSLTVGSYLWDVAKASNDFNNAFSVPAGHSLCIHKNTFEKKLTSYYDLSRVKSDSFDLSAFRDRVDTKLKNGFLEIQRKFPSHNFVVCLSGGLDSSIIAFYASQYLPNVRAASFSFEELSEDFRSAEGIAKLLDLQFVPVVTQRKFEIEDLDKVLIFGQDWRDFNVHCAWVNNILGTELRKSFDPDSTIILTGDLMNEFVADYTAVEFNGVTYYSQPKVPRDRLRNFFVYGLDSGDREIGIFNSHGFTAIQPYSFVAEDYLTVPREYLERSDCKEILNLPLLRNDKIHALIQKKKLRAQVGGNSGGVLGLFHEHSISQEFLSERWKKIFSQYCNEEEVKNFIAAGRYVS